MNIFWRIRRGPLILFTAVLFVAIMAFRFTVDDATEPISFLMVIPIGLLAAEWGLRGGLIGAGIASALVVVWDAIAEPHLTPLGFSLRFLVFLASGVVFGVQAQSRAEIEGESRRWFDQSADLNCVADMEGNFLRVNAAFGELLGYSPAELLGTPFISYVHPDDVEATIALTSELANERTGVGGFENRYRAADGSYRWVRWTSTTDDERSLIYASARDVTETKELESDLRDLAQTDSLTGLLNRRAFQAQAKRQIDFLRRYGPGGGMMLLDIDNFKRINDSFGHKTGDEALQKVAGVIQARTRVTDISARIGGDEFVILFPVVGHNEAELLAKGLLGAIQDQSIGPDGSKATITSSAGIALFSQSDSGGLDVLLANADGAMYKAKRAGGDQFAFARSQDDS